MQSHFESSEPTAVPGSILHIDVVYALAEQQSIVRVALPAGATVSDAVERSGVLHRFPELTERLTCAIFSRVVDLSAPVHAGDRVEILRPLLIDPKERRRSAALRARSL